MPEFKPRGRPRLTDARRRAVTIRLTEAEYVKLFKLAQGQTLADALRRLLAAS
jgi:hypothetical protein